MANIELLDRVIEYIEAHPQEWEQSSWAELDRCGTAHCVAGWAVHLTHPEARPAFADYREDYAITEHVILPGSTQEFKYKQLGAELLELEQGWNQAGAMFAAGNSLADIKAMRDLLAANSGANLNDVYEED